ncbi:MAG: hypothetical protein IPO78_13995 [Saprospiraceae bacterium]|nr:hypothetical protein [Saprospiraceae bacterium]
MKTSSLLFILLILTTNLCTSQKYETGFNAGIDTIVTFDLETNIEVIKIVKYLNVFIDADNCESLPKKFIAKISMAAVAQVTELSAIEFRCNGKFQREWEGEWEIQSFNLVINKSKQAPRTIANLGSQFTEETKKVLAEISSGEIISFEQITLVHPQKGRTTAGFSFRIK